MAEQQVGREDPFFTGRFSGFVIAVFMPPAIMSVRNAASISWRAGIPNELFEAPHDRFTPSSSRIRRIVAIIAVAASGAAPIGIASGSIMHVGRSMPCFSAFSTIFAAAAKRSAGSIEMPFSSFAMPITALPCSATSGSSRPSSDPRPSPS